MKELPKSILKCLEHPPLLAYEIMRRICLRLLGVVGGDRAADVIHQALHATDQGSQIAALTALGNWTDDSQFTMLLEFVDGQQKDAPLREMGFKQALRFLKQRPQGEGLEALWKALAATAVEANSRQEKLRVIHGLTTLRDDWALGLLEFFVEDPDDEVSYKAEKALEKMNATITNPKYRP